ncbi:MAG: hypothetical protein FWE37_04450 [Spirochaetaceae bacterium]|nr:hypothetical protein [Spirochaetaceae bacterium]
MKGFCLVIILIATAGTLATQSWQGNTGETTWTNQYIFVYEDANPQRWGHSLNRVNPHHLEIFDFGLGRIIDLTEENGFLTSVTLNAAVKEQLDSLLAQNPSITIDGRNLRLITATATNPHIVQPFYVYQERERGIFIGFTLEPAPEEMIASILQFYAREPRIGQIVADYYRTNYVIRVVIVNTIHSRSTQPTIYDFMANATLLGDDFQQWFGLYDGLNYLGSLAAFYEERRGFAILTNQYPDSVR